MLNGVKGKDDGDSDSLSALLPEVQPPRQDRHSDKLRHDPAKRFKQFQLCVEKESGIAFISFNFALRLVQIIQATLWTNHGQN